jgi:hypothetical protein
MFTTMTTRSIQPPVNPGAGDLSVMVMKQIEQHLEVMPNF